MRSLLLAACCLAVLSFSEDRAVGLIQAANAPAQIEVVRGIIAGRPYWKAFQNRLLGPEIVWWAGRLTGVSLKRCYEVFCWAAVFVANTICFLLFLNHGKNRARAWFYTVVYAGAFVALQDVQWLYLWDYLDLSFTLLFAWAAVIGGVPWWQFVALLTLQLLNRESAVFIALWLVVDSIRFERTARGALKIRVVSRQFWVGLATGTAGMFWTQHIRNALCLQETGVVPRPEMHETATGQFLMLRVTLDLLREPLTTTSATLLLLIGALVYLLARAWRPLGPRAWKVGLILGVQVAANFCLAFIFELRVWFMLLPWLLCLAYVREVRGPESLSAQGE